MSYRRLNPALSPGSRPANQSGQAKVRNIIVIAVVFNAIVAGIVIWGLTRVDMEAKLEAAKVALLPAPRSIDPFELIDHNGQPISNDALLGKWSFLFFGFTHCPDVCPTAMSVLGQVDRTLREESPDVADRFQGVLVSVDPERDTPNVLRDYVAAFSQHFVGMTGTPADLARFANAVHVAFAKVPDATGGYQVDHSAHIVVINPDGQHHGYIKLPHRAAPIAEAFLALNDT